MRIILGIFMALVLMHVAQATELKFNTQDFAPFNYAIDGVVSGPVAELIQKVCDDMQITCSFRLLAWTRAQETDKKLVDQFNATLVDLYRRGVAQAILKTYNMEPVALDEMEGTASGNK